MLTSSSYRILDGDRRVNELYSKQGRSARFSSKKDRDTWIKKQVKELKQTIEGQKEQVRLIPRLYYKCLIKYTYADRRLGGGDRGFAAGEGG